MQNLIILLTQKTDLKKEYITNILKCRPPANRNPLKDEIEACTPYLEKQIKIIRKLDYSE